MSTARRDSVQSLERAFDLLEALADGEQVALGELATRAGLVPSTAHRLLATLVQRGYVAQNPDSGRYLLGHKLVELASSVERRLALLRGHARTHLERVTAQTGETANLVVLDGDRVVYVDQVEGTRSVRMFTAIGTAALAHTTGSGKAILAFAPSGAAAALYGHREPLERLTPQTRVTVEALERDFAAIRGRGYALDDEEHELGVGCVAAPVFDHTTRPVAAISVSGPVARILGDQAAGLGALVSRHAGQISAALGHH